MINKEYALYVPIKGETIKAVGNVVQNDVGANKFTVMLTDGKNPVDITGYTNVTFSVLKPDGTYCVDSLGDRIVVVDAIIGKISIKLHDDAIDVSGGCYATLEVFSGISRLSSSRMSFMVTGDLTAGANPTTASSWPVLLQLLTDIGNLSTSSDIDYYVSSTGNDFFEGTIAAPFATIQHAIDKLPKSINHFCTIHVVDGTYAETDVTVSEFNGTGAVIIQGNLITPTSVTIGNMIVELNVCTIVVNGIEFNNALALNSLEVLNCRMVNLTSLIFEESVTGSHIYINESTASMTSCLTSNGNVGIGADNHSDVVLTGCSGIDNGTGILVENGSMVTLTDASSILGIVADVSYVTGGRLVEANGVDIKTADLISKKATKEEFDIHTGRADNPHAVTAAQAGAYSKIEMQTTGQSALHWGNLTNVPNMADASWKTSVANRAALPLTGNTINDQRVVLDDGDGKQAMYVCIATSGLVDVQWDKIGDVDWTNDHGNMVGLADDDHTQYHNDIRGDVRYYTKTQSDDALHNRAGAVVKELEIVTTAGQTVLDISAVGSYLVGEKTLSVFKKGITGRYEKLDRDDYVETNATVATLNTAALVGDIYLLSWFENTPELISSYARKDGILQTNLNADMVDGKHYSDIIAVATSIANGYMSSADKIILDGLNSVKTATITTTWVGTSAPYTQEITVAGVTINDEPSISPVYSDTNATALLQQTAWNCVSKIVTGAGKITCTCFEDKPITAIPISIKGV